MAKAKKGDLMSCTECGLVVVVDEVCGCATAEIVCCDVPMVPGKAAASKARKVAAVKPAAKALKAPAKAPVKKAVAKPAPAKAAAKVPAKVVAKAAVKAKPAAKKPPVVKK